MTEPPKKRFQLLLVARSRDAKLGDAFDTQAEAEAIAERILADEKIAIEVHVVDVLASFAKEFRVVKFR